MVERLIAPVWRFNINGQIALGLFLAGIIGMQLRAQADLAVVRGVRLVVTMGASYFCEKSRLMPCPPYCCAAARSARRITSSMERFSMSMPLSAAAASVCE